MKYIYLCLLVFENRKQVVAAQKNHKKVVFLVSFDFFFREQKNFKIELQKKKNR